MHFFKKGVTVLEIIIVIAILILITAIIISPFDSFRKSKALETDIEEVVSLINEARLNTLSSKDAFHYGVHLESSRAVLFRGGTFTEPDANNKEILYSSAVESVNIALAGGSPNIVFDKLTGKTAQYGTFDLRLTSDITRSVTITVEGTGVASHN